MYDKPHVPPVLCPIPWMSQSYRANGDVRICCQAQHGPTGGILKDKEGNIINAKSADLDDLRNSPLAKEIRLSMLKGERHPECVRCHTEEDAGIRSRRHVENELWIKGGWKQIREQDKFTWDYLREHTSEDGTIDTSAIPNKFMDVRFGNLCNLKCRMCGPTDSNQWYDDQVKLWGDTYKDSHGMVKLIPNEKGKHQPEVNVYDWHDSEQYWVQMEKQIPFVKKLYIVGGEPLMIDPHYTFLQKCVDKGYAKDIVVEYNSNLTNIPQRAWNIWKHFRKIGIGASIDAIGDLNRYIRYPSDFKTIWKNLEKLSTAEGNFSVWIAATINVYNVWELPEIIEHYLRNELPRINDDDVKPIISPHPLHGPQFLNIRMLPKAVKDKIAEKYDNSKKHLENVVDECIIGETRNPASKRQLNEILNNYKQFMYAKDFSDKIPKFWEHTNRLDEIRGHSFEKSCPEMYKMLKETEQ